MTCREAIDLLNEYLEGHLPQSQSETFDAHLQVCAHCRDYLDSYRKTMQLERAAFDDASQREVPEELIRAVTKAIREGK